jgi:hypothetical protein
MSARIVREKHGGEHYSQIGAKGGETTRKKLGREHYVRIGRIGGTNRHKRHQQGNDA